MYNEIEGRTAAPQIKPRREMEIRSHSPEWELPEPQRAREGNRMKTVAALGVSALALGLSAIALGVAASGSGGTAANTARKVEPAKHVQPAPHYQQYKSQHGHHLNPHHMVRQAVQQHQQHGQKWDVKMPKKDIKEIREVRETRFRQPVETAPRTQEAYVSPTRRHEPVQHQGTGVGQNVQGLPQNVHAMPR